MMLHHESRRFERIASRNYFKITTTCISLFTFKYYQNRTLSGFRIIVWRIVVLSEMHKA